MEKCTNFCSFSVRLKGLYTGSKRKKVKMDKIGPEFEVERGVKQGDPLAPNLYNAAQEEIFWELDGRTKA